MTSWYVQFDVIVHLTFILLFSSYSFPYVDTTQIPPNWYVPNAASKARYASGTPLEISLRAVIEAQLEEDTASVMLPRYLLLIFQLAL